MKLVLCKVFILLRRRPRHIFESWMDMLLLRKDFAPRRRRRSHFTQILKWSFILFLLSFLFTSRVFANSEYVLPYPSFMPGNRLYSLYNAYSSLSKYWYFGEFGKFEYNLKLADKYLVESKTLFEYKQYLLAYSSLKKSDKYFKDASRIEKINKNGKDEKKRLFKSAASKHIEELNKIKKIIPETILWMPEKEKSTELDLRKTITESIELRQKYE